MRQLIPTHSPVEDAADSIGDDELADRLAYPEKPAWVRAVFVATLDGAAQGPDGRAGSISGPPDRRFFALTRAMADVILVGARTARIEGYGPAGLSPEHRRIRERRGRADPAPIAVVSASLDIPAALLDDPRTIVVTTDRSDPGRRAELARKVEVVVAGT
ncbi:MAG TPA: dihydrofolate reductase family protein, partial [Actinopolymorphaceae bacterium]